MATNKAKQATKSAPIAVLGMGSWGTTVAHLIAQTGHDVRLWGRDQEVITAINKKHENPRYLAGMPIHKRVRACDDLAEAIDGVDHIVMVLPSKAFRTVCQQLAPLVSTSQSILHATKGVERESYKRMSEILLEETCVRQYGVISGPNIAREIMEGKPAGTVVATPFPALADAACGFLTTSNFRVYRNHDVIGVELGGTLKNIIAIASGIASELDLGDNAKGLLLTRGIQEMIRIGLSFGANASTFSGLSGIGDLMVTCASPYSRNFRFGRGLAQGKSREEVVESLGMVAEGVFAARVAVEFANVKNIDIPVMRAVYRAIYEGQNSVATLSSLMENAARPDVDFDPTTLGS